MLDYQYDVTIPANTPASEPYTQSLKLTKGKLVRLILSFQTGCAYMVHVALFIGNHQIMPVIEGQSYAFDGFVLVRDTAFIIDNHPFDIIFKGWSPNTTYEHTIGVIATVQVEDESIDVQRLMQLLS
jgi:hypothetical protein